MSRIIASAAIRGAHKIVKQAEQILAKAIKEKGKDCKVEFPNTGYYIPIIYSMTGRAVEKVPAARITPGSKKHSLTKKCPARSIHSQVRPRTTMKRPNTLR